MGILFMQLLHSGCMKATMATIYEVAERAGVSTATVSRVVNGRAGIGEATRRRVEQVMEAEGFRPRWKAPAGNAVGLVVFPYPGCLSHPYNANLISAACETLFAEGFFVQLIPCEQSKKARQSIRRLLVSHQIQGVMVLALHPTYDVAQDLDCSSVPHVTLGAMPSDSPHCQVAGDDEGAGASALRHLWDLGHRSFAVVTPPLWNAGHAQRLGGIRAALAERGGTESSLTHFECSDVSPEEGASVAARIALSPQRATAAVVSNSSLAKGVMRGFKTRGVRVPEDLSLVGFEDADELLDGEPPITALRQPTRQIGEAAARLLLSQIGGACAPPSLRIPSSLAVRASTAAI